MVELAGAFAKRGLDVDLVLPSIEGPYLASVSSSVRIINLEASRVLFSLPRLIKYFRSERPNFILSAMDHSNVVALLGRRLSGISATSIASVHSNLSHSLANASSHKHRLTRHWIKPFYPWADVIVAVSQGVADDLIQLTGLPASKVKVIYNPVVTPELFLKAAEPLDHPWFGSDQVPVVLGVGRLTAAKDFSTLIRAFAIARAKMPARLIILGEGEERSALEAIVDSLNIRGDVSMPGFMPNPFSYMRSSAVFVLSSRWEGFSNVLAEAMACGTRVVSTNCPSGPSEILEGGRWGLLVPVGDVHGLAESILTCLRSKKPEGMVESATFRFHIDRIVDQYLNLLR